MYGARFGRRKRIGHEILCVLCRELAGERIGTDRAARAREGLVSRRHSVRGRSARVSSGTKPAAQAYGACRKHAAARIGGEVMAPRSAQAFKIVDRINDATAEFGDRPDPFRKSDAFEGAGR